MMQEETRQAIKSAGLTVVDDDADGAFPGMVQTSVVSTVWEAIEQARETNSIVIVDAPPGLGKTEAVTRYIRQYRHGRTWRIVCGRDGLSVPSISKALARQVDARSGWSAARQADFVDIQYATQNLPGVLIVDEANQLGDARGTQGIKVLNYLRSFTDAELFGIVLLGNGEIYRKLQSAPNGTFDQILSRVASGRVEIAGLGKGKIGQPQLTVEDVEAVMAAWHVAGVEEHRQCLRLVAGPGALRALVGAFEQSTRNWGRINALTLRNFS
jgi:hypothetical protein